MNYLAHLHLAEQTPEGWLGGLLGDFVKGRIGSRYPPNVARGIRLHRRIDVLTDAHPVVARSRRRFSAERRRFAGIIVDICYDHFLCRHWDEFTGVDLETFTGDVYRVLEDNTDLLPERLRAIAPRMIANDWLGAYREIAWVGRAIDRVSRRLRRRQGLAGSISEVEQHYRELEADFVEFFPAMINEAGQQRRALQAAPQP